MTAYITYFPHNILVDRCLCNNLANSDTLDHNNNQKIRNHMLLILVQYTSLMKNKRNE